MANISCLPPEILLQIFRLYLKTETQYDFINCVGKVCRSWQKLCKDTSLWQEFDGTLSFEILKEYCKKGILQKCKILVFSEMRSDDFTAEDIGKVYESLPLLNCVNFSNVISSKSEHYFDKLTHGCPELQKIVLLDKLHSHKENKKVFPIHGYIIFEDILKVRGTNLVSLVFSNLYLTASVALFTTIGKSCPNLEVLKVENVDLHGISFPTGHIQSHCPKLRILCLGSPVTITNQAHTVGFRNLEIFRNSSIKTNYLFPRCAIDAVIFESKKLKELDIRGCQFIKSKCLHPVNYSYLEKLNISFGIVYDITCFMEVIQTWSQSLKELDVSDIIDVSLNDVLQSVILNGGLSNLTILNLSGTSVTIPTLKLILENCTRLCVLSLEHCFELGEFSSMYEGETALLMLRLKLISLNL